MLQSHHHRLLNKVPLDEATEVIPVHSEVRQLESAQGRVEKRLIAASSCVWDVRAGQRHDGGAGVRDAPRQPLFCSCWKKKGRWTDVMTDHFFAVLKWKLKTFKTNLGKKKVSKSSYWGQLLKLVRSTITTSWECIMCSYLALKNIRLIPQTCFKVKVWISPNCIPQKWQYRWIKTPLKQGQCKLSCKTAAQDYVCSYVQLINYQLSPCDAT